MNLSVQLRKRVRIEARRNMSFTRGLVSHWLCEPRIRFNRLISDWRSTGNILLYYD